MPLIVDTPSTRRHVLLIGVSRYLSDEWNKISAGVEQEITLARNLFQKKLEYDSVHTISRTDNTLGDQIINWALDLAPDKDDVVVIYYTGHGFVDESGFLRLITSSTEPGKEILAPAATDLVAWLSKIKSSILLIIDTCYSSASLVDAQVVLERMRFQSGKGHRIHFISSAGPIEVARPGWFTEALSSALDEVTSQYDEFIPMENVLASINRKLAKKSLDVRSKDLRERLVQEGFPDQEVQQKLQDVQREHDRNSESMQRARFFGSIEDLPQFFPNQGRLEYSPTMDSQQCKRVLHSIQKFGFRNHWDPRARGVRHGTEDGWFFSGRYKALARLKCGIAAPTPGHILVVAGMAGSGKSAVLARFVTLADQQQRERAERAGATSDIPAAALPDPGSVDIAIWAAKRSVFSLAMEIATASGGDFVLDRDNPIDGLLEALRRQVQDRLVIVIDALDEAEKPSEAALMLAELAKSISALRIVVGIRTGQSGSSVLSRLGATVEEGGNLEIIDLSTDKYWDHDDLEKFVRRYLTEQDGSPYASMGEDYLKEVAHAVADHAKRSFLVASTTARALAHQVEIIAPEALKNLPESAGEAFELDLKRFGTEWRQGIRVIGALAYGQGRGLPRALWPTVASALVGTFSKSNVTRDVEYWTNAAEVYLIHESIGGEEVYRLYHQEFAQHLRMMLDTSPIVCADPVCPHGGSAVCIATALHREVNSEAGLGQLSTHLLEHLPGYLKNGGLAEPLYQLVTANWWKDAKKSVFHDVGALLDDIGMAIDLARRKPPNIPRIIRLCVLSSRQITPISTVRGVTESKIASVEAPPIVIDTLARAGQLNRAALMADNILYALDRCHAHALLAQRLNEQGSTEEARRCLSEAIRTMAAVRGDFRTMVHYWVTRAAHSIGEERIAKTTAINAFSCVRESAISPKTAELSGFYHSAFWAGLCLKVVNERDTLALLKDQVSVERGSDDYWAYSNMSLQTASVVGDSQFLEEAIPCRLGEKFPNDFVKPGNLELALADAGMVDKFGMMERRLRDQKRWPQSSEEIYFDAGKRFVWALAVLGRFDEALDAVHYIWRAEERARALYRISECVESRITPFLKSRLGEAADRIWRETCGGDQTVSNPYDPIEPWRIQSWLAPVYFISGRKGRAVELCDAVSELGIVASEKNSLCLAVPFTRNGKSHVELSLRLTPDEHAQKGIEQALDKGDTVAAEDRLKDINSKRARARAAILIALQHPDQNRALDLALEAMQDASVAGLGELRNVLDRSKPVLAYASPEADITTLELEFLHF